jgi:hypothetical protein
MPIDLGIDGGIILRRNLKEQGVKVCGGLI